MRAQGDLANGAAAGKLTTVELADGLATAELRDSSWETATAAGGLENDSHALRKRRRASASVGATVVVGDSVSSTNSRPFWRERGSFSTWLSLCPFLWLCWVFWGCNKTRDCESKWSW